MLKGRWWGLLLSLGLCTVLHGAPLQLYTEEYPPINFSLNGRPTGLATEVVQDILQRTGEQAPIKVVPWARGYHLALTRPDTGLFVTMRTPEREALFQWVGPLTRHITAFYALRGSGLSLTELDQARGMGDIAVPRDWYSHQHLQSLGFTNLYPVGSPDQVVRMLKVGRVKLAALDDLSLQALLGRGQLQPSDVELLLVFLQSDTYIAFSAQTDRQRVQRWQQALDAMKADGRFAELYGRWLPGVSAP